MIIQILSMAIQILTQVLTQVLMLVQAAAVQEVLVLEAGDGRGRKSARTISVGELDNHDGISRSVLVWMI